MSDQWRVGRRNPHNVYRQHGDEPRGYEHEDHDDSLGYFRFPEDAQRAVDAVNANGSEPQPTVALDRDAEICTREFALGARKFAEWWEPEFGPVIASVSTRGGSSVYLTTAAVRSLAEVAAKTLGDAAEPYRVGDEVTGDRAVGCPIGTTLRNVITSAVAHKTPGGWSVTEAPRADHSQYMANNLWRILELPEEES